MLKFVPSKFGHLSITTLLWLGCYLLLNFSANAQVVQFPTSCPNSDFAMGNFTNWQGFTGSCCPINVPTPGIVPGRHDIVFGGTDPYSCGGLMMVPPGYTTAARLGNSQTGAQAEALRYTFTVSNQNALFIYNYAVVLEDPGHSQSQQPRFEISVKNANTGQVIPCTFYQVAAANNLPGFQTCAGRRWRDWSTIGVDLLNFIGQPITIEARTGDCSQSGHFGYAYLTTKCQPMTISVAYCVGDTVALLIAPPGFQSYQWSTGATTPTITITNPTQIQGPITLTLTSVSGCVATLSVNLTPALVTPNFSASNGCNGIVTFTDQSTVNNGYLTGWTWDFGDGTPPSTVQNPTHTYTQPGNYNVHLTSVSDGGCDEDTIIQITVPPLIQAGINIPANGCGLAQVFNSTTQLIGGGQLQSLQWYVNGAPVSQNQQVNYTFPVPGTYNIMLIATNTAGCSDTATQQLTVYAPPTAQFTAASVCHGSNTIFNNTSSVVGGGLNSYWTFGGGGTSNLTNPQHQYSNPGVYNVQLIVVGPGNCSDTMTRNVRVHPRPTPSFTLPQPCGLTHTFQNTSTIGSGSITGYVWNFNPGFSNQQNPSFTFPNPGTYSVTLTATSDSGCVNSATQQVTLYAVPVANFNGPTTCHPNAVPFANTSTVQGNGQLTYQWNFGDNTNSTLANPSHAYTNPGSYTVQLITTGPGPCIDTATRVVHTPPAPTASIQLPGPCGMTQQFQSNSTISNGTITNYSWNFNPGNSTAQNPTYTFANPGTYNVSLTVTSDSGCTNTIVAPYTVNAFPSASFNGPTTCHPNAIPFANTTNVQGGGQLNYTWNFGDNTSSTQTQPTHAYTNPGSYTVQLIVSGPGGCADTVAHVVNTPPTPAAAFTLPGQCGLTQQFTDNSTISSGSISNYSWNFNPGSSNNQNPSNSFQAGGTYNVTLTVTSDSGCVSTVTQPYTVYAIPTASFTSPQTCHPLAVPFTSTSVIQGGSPMTYQWDYGDNTTGTGGTPSHNYINPGPYNVQLIATGPGGCVDTSVLAIYVPATPVADFAYPNDCGLSNTFNDQSTISLDNITQWDWDFGDNTQASNQLNPNHTYAQQGTWNVSLIVTSNYGCSDTVVYQFLNRAVPVADFTSTTVCFGVPTDLLDQSVVQNDVINQWAWDLVTAQTTTQNGNYIFPQDGTVPVELIVWASNGCSDTIVKNVTIHPMPYPNFTANPVCRGLTTQFNDQTTINSGNIAQYDWDMAQGNSQSQNPSITYTGWGDYSVNLEVTSDQGCVNDVTIPVHVWPRPRVDFEFNPRAGCSPLFGQFEADADIPEGTIATLNWDFGDDNNGVGSNPTHTYVNPGVYSVSLTATSNQGCDTTVTKANYITAFPVPVAEFNYDPAHPTVVDPDVQFNNLTTGGITYWWDFGDGSANSTQSNPSHIYVADTGTYIVVLATENEYGCKDTVEHVIIIKPDYTIYIPNTFTPNANGHNETFRIYGVGIREAELYIFNRWGDKIAEMFKEEPMEKGWDGTHGGSIVKEDIYVYRAKVMDLYGKWHEFFGQINVIR